MFATTVSRIAAEAEVPEQLTHYVQAVSGRKAMPVGEYVAYTLDRHAVLIAYPGGGSNQDTPPPADLPGPVVADASLGRALEELALTCSSVSVLAPFLPAQAPEEAQKAARYDSYWQLRIPPPRPGEKLRNMLCRASRELKVDEEHWSGEHQALVARYLSARELPPGTRDIFSALSRYVTGEGHAYAPGSVKVVLVAARVPNNTLAGFSIGDFSGLRTSFYMFSFRHPEAPPGTADLLLDALVRKSVEFGHMNMNLGLGINGGIGFFKKKWGALPCLPYVETSWSFGSVTSEARGVGGWLRRLFR